MDADVPALLGPDGPRRPDVVRFGDQNVVPALAVRRPDRVDRRQVDDVEAELRELRQRARDTGEAAPRARKELVPRAEARQPAVDVDTQLGLRAHLAVTVSGRSSERILERDVAAEQHAPLRELACQILLTR